MLKAEQSVTIDRPVEEVWEYINDPRNDTEWQSMIVEAVQVSEGPVGAGTVKRVTAKVLGRRFDTTFEVTEYEPNRRSRIKSTSGPFAFTGTYEVERADGGTRFTWAMEGDPGGFFKLAEPLVVRVVGRQVQADMETLKDLLETRE